MRIELLYPEIANLHGDNHNVVYLQQCLEASGVEVEIVRTALTESPAFAHGDVDLVHLGPMTESGQLKAIERLRPHAGRLAELVEAGTAMLFTHNAYEVLGERIVNPDMGYDVAGLDLLPFATRLSMFGRYTGKVMGDLDLNGVQTTVVGYKSQFSMVEADESLRGFLVAERGIGRNRGTRVEGVRWNNLFGTSLLGPLLVTNPDVTRHLLAELAPGVEPVLAHEPLARAAYDARLAEFRDPARWHPHERVLG